MKQPFFMTATQTYSPIFQKKTGPVSNEPFEPIEYKNRFMDLLFT